MNRIQGAFIGLSVLHVVLALGANPSDEIKIDSNVFGAIEARSIGPAVMGGRIAALDVVNSSPRVIYVALPD